MLLETLNVSGLMDTNQMFSYANILLVALALEAGATGSVRQIHRDGNAYAADRLAVISVSGTIMPPATERWIRQIRHAADDEAVRGVVVEIDSPGGLVADSHQLYHELQKLRQEKPVYVAMKRIAASGGLYLAMGAGPDAKIFAEPTTWTGSIGVIIPRYNAAELAQKIGVKAEPLATGPLKGSLNPFRDLRDDEREVWNAIISDSFERFLDVIAENRRTLDRDAVRALATGQVYTAAQALENGLIDETGFSEDAVESLAQKIGLSDYAVVEYASPPTLMDLLLGTTRTPPGILEQLMDAAVPRAFYYCSWNPVVPDRP